jgi:hypothetical protein
MFAPDSLCTDQDSEDGGGRHCPSPSILGLGATSCLIGETLAFGPSNGAFGARNVVNAKGDPIVISEVKFAQITVQVGFGDVLVNTVDATLENAEIALDAVGGDKRSSGALADVFLLAVIDGAVRSEVVADKSVVVGFIGHQVALKRDVAGHDAAQIVGPDVGHVERTNLAAALDQRHDGLFLGGRQEGLAGRFAADIGFVHFHNPIGPAHRFGEQAAIGLHCLPDAMGEEPCGFHAAFEHALNLAGADPLLAGAHQVDDLQPQMQRQVAVLEDGPHPYREGLFASVALPQAHPGGLAVEPADPVAIRVPTMGARRAIGPKHRLDMSEGGGFVLEMGSVENGFGHVIYPN